MYFENARAYHVILFLLVATLRFCRSVLKVNLKTNNLFSISLKSLYLFLESVYKNVIEGIDICSVFPVEGGGGGGKKVLAYYGKVCSNSN